MKWSVVRPSIDLVYLSNIYIMTHINMNTSHLIPQISPTFGSTAEGTTFGGPCVKIPLSHVIVFSSFALNLKTIITWWAWPNFIILVFRVSNFNSLESLLGIVQNTEIYRPPGRTTLVIIFIFFFPLSILVNSLLTSPGSCDQDPLIPIFPIQDFRKYVTGIFSLVIGDDC